MDSINLNEVHKFLLEIVPKCGDVCNFFELLLPVCFRNNFEAFLKTKTFLLNKAYDRE